MRMKYVIVPIADRFQVHEVKSEGVVGADVDGEHISFGVGFTQPLNETFATKGRAAEEVKSLIEIYGDQ